MGLTKLFLPGILVFILVVTMPSCDSFAQDNYYINTYLMPNMDTPTNALMKINLVERRVTDSLIFDRRGEYFQKAPASIAPFQGYSFLLSFFNGGLAAKNSEVGQQTYTYYYVVNAQDFNIIRQDSLANTQVTRIVNARRDSLIIDLIDGNTGGWRRGRYFFNRNTHRLDEIDRRAIPSNPVEIVIGEYINPIYLGELQNHKYYYDLVDGASVALIAVDSLNNITYENIIGDITQSAVVIGFDPENRYIYNVILRFRFLSSEPEYSSSDTIRNQLIKIDPSTLIATDSLILQPGDAYFTNEIGKADVIGNLFIYYFSKGDGYKRFDPAYMLIFDTRTNEATWLRVGWR
jgi:hypothetical protein